MSEILVNTNSGKGLMSDGTKSLPEQVLNYHEWIVVAIENNFNSSPPSVTYMCQGTKSILFPEMACCLISNNLGEIIITYCQLDPFQWNLNQHTQLFVHENVYQNVICEMAAILSRRMSWFRSVQDMKSWNEVVNLTFNITATSFWGQWVNGF